MEEMNEPELIDNIMDTSDDFIRRPVTPPSNLSPAIFVNESPVFERSLHSPVNKGLNKLLDSPIPSKRLEFCKTFSSTPLQFQSSCKKRHIITCPPIRHKLHHFAKSHCVTAENSKPKNIKTTVMEHINPFTPDGRVALKRSLKSSKSDSSIRKFLLNDSSELDESNTFETSVKRAKLREINVERYCQEFVELEEIGKGVHGSVFKCLNRMNGCIYAIKKSNKEIVNSTHERIVRNEVYAHGILEHPNLVRNYSSWPENGFVYIQNEYCNGGCLTDYVENHLFTDQDAKDLLYQISSGLRYIHEKGLAHMDIKPDNIFIHEKEKLEKTLNNNLDINLPCTSTSGEVIKETIYKLGDFGHVVSLGDVNVEDGDCRYLSMEIIQDNYSNLDKADIFSLGLTIYEVISRVPLPKNGPEWQSIREGQIKYLDLFSPELNNLLKAMIETDPMNRPSASAICDTLSPNSKGSKSNQEIYGFLQQINNNINVLQHRIDFTSRYSKTVCQYITDKCNSLKRANKERLLVGKKQQRSSSTTTF